MVSKAMVAALLLAGVVGTIGACATTWITLTDRQLDATDHTLWTFPMIIVATDFSALVEQLFLTHRIYLLSRSKIIAIFLILLVLGHTVLNIICAVLLSMYGTLLLFSESTWRTMLGNATMIFSGALSAAVDLLIPIILTWKLRQICADHYLTPRSGYSLVRRICVGLLASGFVVAIIGVIAIVLFSTGNMTFILLWSCLGRIYGPTVMINLLNRRERDRPMTPVSVNLRTPGYNFTATELPAMATLPMYTQQDECSKPASAHHSSAPAHFSTFPRSSISPAPSGKLRSMS